MAVWYMIATGFSIQSGGVQLVYGSNIFILHYYIIWHGSDSSMNSELLFLSKNERQHKHGQYRFGLAYGVYRHFQQYFS